MANQLGALMLAGLFLFLALAALALMTLMASRRRPGDPLLAAFACFVALFGARLAADTEMARNVLSPGVSEVVTDVATYIIPLPTLLATRRLVTGTWRVVAQALVVYQIVFIVAAIGVDLGRGRPGSGMVFNNASVAALLLVAILYALSRRAEWGRALRHQEGRVLAVALPVFVFVALSQNLGEIGLRPGSRGPESLALLVLVSAVGYALALRVGRRETQLIAIERELELARSIQLSLLPPRLPQVAGLDVAARYVSASAVAGDFYDVISDDERRIAVIVADVTGHGVPAALVASMMKVACASDQGLLDPSRGLARVNRLLSRSETRRYVTAAWLNVDAPNKRFVYGAAGHPPLLIWRATTGSIECVVENGLLLGAIVDASYTQMEGVLHSGDRLLLYTDGVIEASAPGGEFFEQCRLEEALIEGIRLDADTFCDSLLANLQTWHGNGPFEDDVTFVVIDVS